MMWHVTICRRSGRHTVELLAKVRNRSCELCTSLALWKDNCWLESSSHCPQTRIPGNPLSFHSHRCLWCLISTQKKIDKSSTVPLSQDKFLGAPMTEVRHEINDLSNNWICHCQSRLAVSAVRKCGGYSECQCDICSCNWSTNEANVRDRNALVG